MIGFKDESRVNAERMKQMNIGQRWGGWRLRVKRREKNAENKMDGHQMKD